MKRRALLATLAGGALLPLAQGCGTSELPDKRRELLQSWGERFLLASYAEFESACAELAVYAGALRDDPNADTLEAARGAWWRARSPWKRAEIFAFGPYSDGPRLGARIDFWPARPDTIEEVLEDDGELDASALDRLGAPAKGLPALEYLLYTPELDVVEAFEAKRRGDYAVAIAEDLVLRARELWEAWDPGHENFLNELVGAGRTSARFMTLNAALEEVINRIGYMLENDRAEQLGKALSGTSAPQPELLVSIFSGRSLDDLRDNLSGVELLYWGDAGRGLLGLDAYLQNRGKKLGPTFRALDQACHAAFDAVPGTLAEALVDDPDSVRRVASEIGRVENFFQVDVINALSLSLGFNDNDGD